MYTINTKENFMCDLPQKAQNIRTFIETELMSNDTDEYVDYISFNKRGFQPKSEKAIGTKGFDSRELKYLESTWRSFPHLLLPSVIPPKLLLSKREWLTLCSSTHLLSKHQPFHHASSCATICRSSDLAPGTRSGLWRPVQQRPGLRLSWLGQGLGLWSASSI